MNIFQTFLLAVRAILRNKLRSSLTMLGLIFGVGAVVAVVGIGNGARSQVEAQISSLGENVILVFSGSMTSGGARGGYGSSGTLTIEDSEAMVAEIPGIVSVSPEIRTSGQISAGNQNWSPSIMGEGPEYFDIRQWQFVSGNGFGEAEVRGASKVAVIGRTASAQLFGSADPVGEVIRIKNVPFLIIGYLKPKGTSIIGSDQDDSVIVPYTTAMKRISGDTKLRSIIVKARSAQDLTAVSQQMTDLLRQRHRIGPGRDDDFFIRNQQEIAEMATATSKIMALLLGIVAGVSLIVGGIGIMNIMLVSVTERTREIGIRMAVGAFGGDILKQFLIEAVTLSSLGGLLGIGFGLGLSRLVSTYAGWPVLVSMDAVLVSFGFSSAVGVLFGLYPAWKASTLNPIDALRYE